MPSIMYEIRTKGLRGTLARATQVIGRYGLTSSKMRDRVHAFADLMESFGAKPSFPTTANVVAHHPDFFRQLSERVELVVHGLYHEDYRSVPSPDRRWHFMTARRIFEKIGVSNPGFRAPYLGVDDAVLADVRDAGYAYDSSTCVFWPVVEEASNVRLALDSYNAGRGADFGRPCIRDGLVLIPASIPDDEILIERAGIRNGGQLAKLWSRAMGLAIDAGVPFVPVVHPERFPDCRQALNALLTRASGAEPPIPIVTLQDLAIRASEGVDFRCLCITGDIDVLALGDLFYGVDSQHAGMDPG